MVLIFPRRFRYGLFLAVLFEAAAHYLNGQTLGVEVVAVGVETRAQSEMLMQFGSHSYQGYLFGKSVTQEEFERDL